MEDGLDARLVALETMLAETQRTLDDLSEVVIRQGEQLDALKAQVEILGREILRDADSRAEPPGAARS